MNRQQRRQLLSEQRQHVQTFPDRLTLLPEAEWPHVSPRPQAVWRSKKYLVQQFDETADYPGAVRLSVCRTQLGGDGRWRDGLTWDELQSIKREVGFADYYAIEIYPRDRDIVNVANFRHIWVLPEPLSIGWFSKRNPR